MKKTYKIIALNVMLGGMLTSASAAPYITGAFGFATKDSKLERFNLVPSVPLKDSSDISGRGLIGQFAAGYEFLLNGCITISPEASASLSTVKGSSESKLTVTVQHTVKVKASNSFGAGLKIGCRHDKFTPFVKVGLKSSSWKVESISTVLPVKKSKNRRLLGVEATMGIDYNVSSSVSIGADFTYGIHKTLHMIHEHTADMKFKPRTSAVMLRTTYKFG